MTRQIVLTEQEYSDLIEHQQKPSDELRSTCVDLKAKLQACKSQQPTNHNTGPFRVTDNTLLLSDISDFVVLYNGLSIQHNCTTLRQADMAIYNYLLQLANIFGYNLTFNSQSELKQYRVLLRKRDLVITIKKNECIHLMSSTI